MSVGELCTRDAKRSGPPSGLHENLSLFAGLQVGRAMPCAQSMLDLQGSQQTLRKTVNRCAPPVRSDGEPVCALSSCSLAMLGDISALSQLRVHRPLRSQARASPQTHDRNLSLVQDLYRLPLCAPPLASRGTLRPRPWLQSQFSHLVREQRANRERLCRRLRRPRSGQSLAH